jgi:hypothetical protein
VNTFRELRAELTVGIAVWERYIPKAYGFMRLRPQGRDEAEW